jgi:hypothetical protein
MKLVLRRILDYTHFLLYALEGPTVYLKNKVLSIATATGGNHLLHAT